MFNQDFYILPPFQRKVHHFVPGVMPGVSLVGRFETNARGIRGRNFSKSDTTRILALGCSVTISTYIDQDKTWAALLEKKISDRSKKPVWVGHVGKSEATTRDMLTVFEYFVPQFGLELDTIVILTGVNDMALMLSKGEQYNPHFIETANLEYRLGRIFDWFPNRYRETPDFRQSAGWKVLRSLRNIATKEVWKEEGKFYIEKKKRRSEAGQIRSSLPDLSVGLDEYSRNIKKMIDLARTAGIRPVFVSQPYLWKANQPPEENELLWFGWIAETQDFYSSGALGQAMEAYNQQLISVCAECEAETINIAKMIPKNTNHFYDDVHLNEGGSEKMSDILGDYFLTHPKN